MASQNGIPTVVSLFAGAGGMDVGLERAGWRTTLATDSDTDCIATLSASKSARIAVRNWPGRFYLEDASIVEADVRELTCDDLRPPGADKNWRPGLLAGGPPCQPWSSAGLQKGLSDDRGQLIQHMIRLTGELLPHFVLFENVRGLVTALGSRRRPGEVLEQVKHAFEDLGYATIFATINAADYGAPQRRVRLFMLASRAHALPSFPEPTHGRHAERELHGNRKPWVTLGDFLARLPAPDPADVVHPTPQRAEELASLAPGTGLRTGGRVESNRPGGHWGYRQDCFVADPARPSRTIRAATTPDWIRLPDGTHRRHTWRECAALQGFPVDWRFVGKTTSKFRQVGNAVQATVAEKLGRALMASFLAGEIPLQPTSAALPTEFARRIQYTVAEHRTNGQHRVRVRASVP